MNPSLLNDLIRLRVFKPELNWERAPVYVYGTGSFASDIQRVLLHHGVGMQGFIDHRYHQSDAIGNSPVFREDDPRISLEQRTSAAVILGIHNREVHVPAIIQRLKRSGYKRILSPIELYDRFAVELKDRYWLTSRMFYSSFEQQIEAVYEMLSDQVSRETFAALLRFRITGDYFLLPIADTEHQYVPLDLPAWPKPIRFVDCGAYDGDTLRAFVEFGYSFESVVAFEPDQDNFRKLGTCVAGNKNGFPNAALFPCGLYSSTTQLTFAPGTSESSALAHSGSSMIQCVSLDESIPTFRPTLIKMDIEGAEVEALLGAQKLIADCQPALAISAYHTPAHLWEIPLLVDKIASQHYLHYTYHMRAHAHNCFDTIFYAIPKRSS